MRLHLGLAGGMGWTDSLLFGQPASAGAMATWGSAKGHSVGDLLRATVAANEVGGRVGASLLLGPGLGLDGAPAVAASVATALGLLEGLDADTLAHAIGLALCASTPSPRGVVLGGAGGRALAAAAPGLAAMDAVDLARAGMTAPLNLLDDPTGPLSAWSYLPLRHAFTGLGSAWLTDTLAFRLDPLHPYAQVPVQATMEVLRRHVRAADKRLRADQVDCIVVTTGAPGWMLEQQMEARPGLGTTQANSSIRRAIGLAVATHDLGPASFFPACLDAVSDRVAHVAHRVEVQHDWSRSAALLEHAVDVWGPLLSGLSASELRRAAQAAAQDLGHRLPTPGAADLVALLKLRPAHLLERLRYAPHDLGAARLDQWQERLDTEVVVMTTRGGSWPERRALPEGSPGWPWADTQRRVLERFGDGAEAVKQAAIGEGAEGWVEALLR